MRAAAAAPLALPSPKMVMGLSGRPGQAGLRVLLSPGTQRPHSSLLPRGWPCPAGGTTLGQLVCLRCGLSACTVASLLARWLVCLYGGLSACVVACLPVWWLPCLPGGFSTCAMACLLSWHLLRLYIGFSACTLASSPVHGLLRLYMGFSVCTCASPPVHGLLRLYVGFSACTLASPSVHWLLRLYMCFSACTAALRRVLCQPVPCMSPRTKTFPAGDAALQSHGSQFCPQLCPLGSRLHPPGTFPGPGGGM